MDGALADYNLGAGTHDYWQPLPYIFTGDNQYIQTLTGWQGGTYTFVHEVGHVLDVHYLVDTAGNPWNFDRYKLAYSPPWEESDPSTDYYKICYAQPGYFNYDNGANRLPRCGPQGFIIRNEMEDFAENFAFYILSQEFPSMCPSNPTGADLEKRIFLRGKGFNGVDCSDLAQTRNYQILSEKENAAIRESLTPPAGGKI